LILLYGVPNLLGGFSAKNSLQDDADMFEKFKQSMMFEFDMSDIGMMHYFLGIEVVQSVVGIFITQRKYTREILDRFEIKNCNLVETPTEVGLQLLKYPKDGRKVDIRVFK